MSTDTSIDNLGYEDYKLSTGIDWLTVTTFEASVAEGWYRVFQSWKEYLTDKHGNPGVKKWGALGYKGWALSGMRIGGNKADGFIIVLSGADTGHLWRQFVEDAVNITRFDLAVTTTIGFEFGELAERYWARLSQEDMDRRKYSLVRNSKGGQTLYVGSRSSDQFGRVYDKGAQQGDYPNGFKWRYEVEYKKPRASIAANALKQFETQEAKKIVDTVHSWFAHRGVPPIFHSTGDGIRIQMEARVDSDKKKLNWLRSQVAPSIEYLLSRGRGREALVALGLIDFDIAQYEVDLTARKSQGKI